MIKIIIEGGHQGPRTENPYRILVNGKIFKTESGASAFWTEADALRACAKSFGFIPQERATYMHKDSVNDAT